MVKPAVDGMMLDIYMLSKKKVMEIVLLGEAKPKPDSGSADIPMQCRAK